MMRSLLSNVAVVLKVVTVAAGVLTLASFLMGFKVPYWLGEDFSITVCRQELGYQNAPPRAEPVELSSKVLPVRTVCRWPDGTEVEVEIPGADELTLCLLQATGAAGLLLFLTTLLARRISPREAEAEPSRHGTNRADDPSKGSHTDD